MEDDSQSSIGVERRHFSFKANDNIRPIGGHVRTAEEIQRIEEDEQNHWRQEINKMQTREGVKLENVPQQQTGGLSARLAAARLQKASSGVGK